MRERRWVWPLALAIVGVGLERLAWLSLRSITGPGIPIDHFVAAQLPAYRVAAALLAVAIPLLLAVAARLAGTSLRAALCAGWLATVPGWLIAAVLQSGRFQRGPRFLWYRLMDFQTVAHYPADLVRSAIDGRFSLAPPPHWLSLAGSSPWRPIELYTAIGWSAVFWAVLFSMLAHQPGHRRRLRALRREALHSTADD